MGVGMKNVWELKDYELLHIIESYRLNVKNSYWLYEVEYVWDEIIKRYKQWGMNYGSDRYEVYKLLKQNESYNLLNSLIGKVANTLLGKEDSLIDNSDIYFYDNLNLLYDKMHAEYQYERNNYLKKKETELPKIEKHEVVTIVEDILDQIDNNGEWKEIYKEALNEGKIIYVDMLTDEDITRLKTASLIDTIENGGTLYNQSNGEIIGVFLKYVGDINDIYLTMHEIIHYINKYLDKEKIKPILKEFPSIFYEFYSLKCLEGYGYSKESLEIIKNTRRKYIINAYEEIKDIMYYLTLYKKDGYINSNNDLLGSKRVITIRRNRTVEKLIMDPDILLSTYPYIIGTYLANQGIEAIDSDKVIGQIIKYVTEHLSAVDEGMIFNILEYSNKNNKLLKKRKR